MILSHQQLRVSPIKKNLASLIKKKKKKTNFLDPTHSSSYHFISFSSFATTPLKGISSLTCLLSHLLLTPHPDTIRLMLPLLDQIHLSLRLSITLMLNLMVTCLFSYSFLNSIQCIIQYSSSLPS